MILSFHNPVRFPAAKPLWVTHSATAMNSLPEPIPPIRLRGGGAVVHGPVVAESAGFYQVEVLMQ
jgi:hypothetical protein